MNRWRENNRERAREHDRRYYERNRERYAEKRRRRELTPKGRAGRMLREAVRSGKVVKPSACHDCGEVQPLQGHHHDYSKPLEVEWLCSRCHGKRHTLARDEQDARLSLRPPRTIVVMTGEAA